MNRIAANIRSLFTAIKGPPRSRASFEQLFHRFREVLDSNNRSLEIITDMGDTLGGDYLFDIQYVKRSYADLRTAVEHSLEYFDALTLSRYPQLSDIFSKIDEQIRHVIDDRVVAPETPLVFYENVVGDMARTIGGKNSNLAEVKNVLKLEVPDAFAITIFGFDAFMRHNRIFERVLFPEGDSPVPDSTRHELYELVLHGTMPPELSRAIEKAVKKIRERSGKACALAIRSSGGEEDGDFSFAGQFETILNVPPETGAVEKAYQKVIASLFSEKAAIYQAQLGYDLRNMKMSVGCMAMVDAAVSGVLYTVEPQGDTGVMNINASWGLGTSVVEGQTDADLFRVKKNDHGEILESRIGAKMSMVVSRDQGEVLTVATPEEKRRRPSLSPQQVEELYRLALLIERHFKRPQDIEWAIDKNGKVFILQSRPLRLSEDARHDTATVATDKDAKIIVKNLGKAVQKGVAAGRVFILKNEHDLDSIPRGAILVARHDSSHFIRVMTQVSAIITDTGTPMSHMAALCREFKIPTVVNAGQATELLAQGQEITVHVESEGATVYEGLDRLLVERAMDSTGKMENLFEYRRKKYLLRYIAPLNLVDPLRDEFTPQACKTMHDILRFIHEKSVVELIESAQYAVRGGTVKLDLSIPADITIIDIGGGLNNVVGADHVTADQVTSRPLQAIIRGMTLPGIWRSDSVPLNVHDFMSSMLRMPDITSGSVGRAESNMAVISKEYTNISLKFGYHFIVVDCYCGENARNNHIYFRFAGGATDMAKRSRRLQLIAEILSVHGFNIKTRGDFIIARFANISQKESERVLDQLGRLFSYTRQLDALLNDDRAVERYARNFLNGQYDL